MAFSINTQPLTINGVRNRIVWQATADAAWATFDSYELRLVLEYEPIFRSDTWAALATLRGFPGSTGLVIWDAQRRLESIVEAEAPGSAQGTGIEALTKTIRRWRWRIDEYINGVATTGSTTTAIALRAGFSRNSSNVLQTWTLVDNKFLSQAPRTQRIIQGHPAWLNYLVPAGTTAINLRVAITYTDGTTSTITAASSSSLSDYDLLRLPAGYTQLLSSQTQEVSSYQVFVTDQADDSEISERMTFRLVDCKDFPRFFLFENSLGGYDTLYTTGVAKAAISTEGETLRRVVSPLAGGTVPEMVHTTTRHNENIEQYVGFSDRERQAWLRDLLRTESAFRVGGRYQNETGADSLIPILIDRGRTALHEDGKWLNEFKFNYSLAIEQEAI